jgi:hypothetical protein
MTFSLFSLSLTGRVQPVVVIDTIACDEPFTFVWSCLLTSCLLTLRRRIPRSAPAEEISPQILQVAGAGGVCLTLTAGKAILLQQGWLGPRDRRR